MSGLFRRALDLVELNASQSAQDVATAASQAAQDAALANAANDAQGDALLAFKRNAIGAVASTLHLWHEAQVVNVKSDFGAVGNGVADDTAAIQAAADYIANFQTLQITAHKLTKAVLFFPDGNYLMSAAVKIRGFLALIGVGTGYTGGSVLRQTVAETNIFEFYGSVNDARSLGVVVEGFNFEFLDTLATPNGVALYFPRLAEDGVTVLSSNSHYIRRNRFGGWHRRGRFIKMEQCNDVEISSNVIDVCDSRAIELGDAAVADAKCTDVRIFGNGFYYCQTAIALRNVRGVAIDGSNSFFEGFNQADWIAIDMSAGGAPIVAGRIEAVIIGGNEFGGPATCYRIDGSARNVTIAPSAHTRCMDYPIATTGATDVEQLQLLGGTFKVDATYPRGAIVNSPGCKIKNSTIADVMVDASGIDALAAIVLEQSGPASALGAGMTYRNNRIVGNAEPPGLLSAGR